VSAPYHSAMARTDTASRVIAAPLDRVFAALVDPEALTAWLPPEGMSGRFERFDARPGGSYRLVLTYADASSARGKATPDSDIVDAHFVDVVPAGISAKDHAAGLASSLANLATYLEQ
jgi:uncharacterized protein YndB with AHSA1/START domain